MCIDVDSVGERGRVRKFLSDWGRWKRCRRLGWVGGPEKEEERVESVLSGGGERSGRGKSRELGPLLTSGPTRTPDLLIHDWKETDMQPVQNTKEVEEIKVQP